jgi:hypothetical protein
MKIDKDIFAKDGYILIKKLFSPDEIDHYRGLLIKCSNLNDSSYDGKNNWDELDGVSKRKEFWPIIYNEKLLSILSKLVPTTPRYLQYSDLHVHMGGVGWHRDHYINKNIVGDDLKKIGALRVAMYFQSYQESHFFMGVIPGSHISTSLFNMLETKLWSIFRKLTGRLPFFYLSLKPMWLKIDAGDCLIFDSRVLHSGSKIVGPKYSIYTGYGEDNNKLSESQIDYLHGRKDLNYPKCPPELVKILKKKNLLSKYLIIN